MHIQPIIFTTREDDSFLSELKQRIESSDGATYLLNYPTVYIHYWISNTVKFTDENGTERVYEQYDVYVGESNDVVNRTKQHYETARNPKEWQNHLLTTKSTPVFIAIGHKHFNKSFTLDIENKLIEYISSVPRALNKCHNDRPNPQNQYYPDCEFSDVFKQVWGKLHKSQAALFPSESVILNSNIFKASPLKRLSDQQLDAKETIISKVLSAVNRKMDGQLVFVQGEAGTGKTVLTTSTFYEIVKMAESITSQKIDCHLVVNHEQQLLIFKELARRLDLGIDLVSKPTSFINSFSEAHKVDVCFVDEGHLLLTQGKMSYQGKNQLQDIINRSRVTVVMFDEYQVLTTEEYWENSLLQDFIQLSRQQNNYISLNNQLRMNCSQATQDWLNSFIVNRTILPFTKDANGYEVRSFDSPQELQRSIERLSQQEESRLSRIVASYDWEYSDIHRPTSNNYWGVSINDWFLPWNYEISKQWSRSQKRKINNLAWAEQPHTIGEVGSTFTIQGFDLSYVGVILGPSVQFRNGHVQYDPTFSKNGRATRQRTLSDGSHHSFGDLFIRNEVKVLMTRGVKGLYVYAVDDELRKALKEIAHI